MRNHKSVLARASAVVLAMALAVVATDWVLTLSARRTTLEAVRPVPPGDAVPRTEAADVAPVAHLFGGTAAMHEGNIRLLGVIAQGAKGKGIALLAVDGRPAAPVRAGEPIAAGATLAEVRRDRVVVDQAGDKREIRLPVKPAPSGIAPARKALQ